MVLLTNIPARNPGTLTGPGNNTWLLDGARPTLIDAGVGHPEHLDELARHLAGRPLALVLVTHGHPDHASGVPALRQRWPSVAVHKWPAADAPHLEPLHDGEQVSAGDALLKVIHTPGHAVDHVCFWEPQSRGLFCGDMMTATTTIKTRRQPERLPGVSEAPVGPRSGGRVARARPRDWGPGWTCRRVPGPPCRARAAGAGVPGPGSDRPRRHRGHGVCRYSAGPLARSPPDRRSPAREARPQRQARFTVSRPCRRHHRCSRCPRRPSLRFRYHLREWPTSIPQHWCPFAGICSCWSAWRVSQPRRNCG